MGKQDPLLDWQVLENGSAWPPPMLPSMPPPDTASHARRLSRRWWALAILLVVLLPALIKGYRENRHADEAMARVEHEVAAVAEEQAAPNTMVVANKTPSTAPGSGRESIHEGRLEARKIEVRGDYAMVEVWAHTSNLPWLPAPYRLTRFYHESEQGWLPTQPPDLFWQTQKTFQAGRITFIYSPRDADAVWEAAPQVEALDAKLRAELGLPPTDKALMIKVINDALLPRDPVELMGASNGANLYAPSPFLLPLPASISEGDALLQLVAGLLLRSELRILLGSSAQACAWQNVTNGLHLWLLDEHSELPSQLLYNAQAFFHRRLDHGILPRLAWFDSTRSGCSPNTYQGMSAGDHQYDGAAVAFIDYAVHAYGRDRLPALIAAMKRYRSWETLIPAVFGVSAAEFEAGWQAWLLEQSRFQ